MRSHPILLIVLAARLIAPGAITAQSDSTGSIRVVATRWFIAGVVQQQLQHFSTVCVRNGVGPAASTHAGPMPAGAELDSATLAALRPAALAVQPASGCDIPAGPGRVTVRDSDAPAMELRIGSVRFDPDGRARLRIDYRADGRYAGGVELTLAMQGGAWTVVDSRLSWIA